MKKSGGGGGGGGRGGKKEGRQNHIHMNIIRSKAKMQNAAVVALSLCAKRCSSNRLSGQQEEEKKRRTRTVQSNSRWYVCARKSPYALHPVSQTFPQQQQQQKKKKITEEQTEEKHRKKNKKQKKEKKK